MRKATIRINRNDDAVLQEGATHLIAAWNRGQSGTDVFTFSSPAHLFSVLEPGAGTRSKSCRHSVPVPYGLAHALGRDVKRVHDDVSALIEWGFIERNTKGKILVPFDVIHADFDLRAAA